MFIQLLLGATVLIHDLNTTYGGHYGTSMDPHEAWAGEMNMFASPNKYDVIYIVDFDDPVELSQLTLVYDGGASVRVSSILKKEIGRQDCYETDGNSTTECVIKITDAGYVSRVEVIIDSNRKEWNWMGNYTFWDTDGRPVKNDWLKKETLMEVQILYGHIGRMDTTSTYGGRIGTSVDPLAAWAGEMNMNTSPDRYYTWYHVTFKSAVKLSHLSVVYDGGATVTVTNGNSLIEYGRRECYGTNRHNPLTCIIQLSTDYVKEVRVKVRSDRLSWNWMGDFKLWDTNGNAIVNNYGAKTVLWSLDYRLSWASWMYDIETEYGGHSGTSLDPLAAWEGEINMWATPNKHDVKYTVRFNPVVKLAKLSLTYDGGATVKVTDRKGRIEYGREECYLTSGSTSNECFVDLHTENAVDEVRVVINSNRDTWNWMGDYIFWDINGQPIRDWYSASPTRVPTKSPNMWPTLLPTPYPTFLPTTNPTKAPSKVPSAVPTTSPSAKPTEIETRDVITAIFSFKSVENIVLAAFIFIIFILLIVIICCMVKRKNDRIIKIKQLEIELNRNLGKKNKCNEWPGTDHDVEESYTEEGQKTWGTRI